MGRGGVRVEAVLWGDRAGLLHSQHEGGVDEGVAGGLFGVHLDGEEDEECVEKLQVDEVGVVSKKKGG